MRELQIVRYIRTCSRQIVIEEVCAEHNTERPNSPMQSFCRSLSFQFIPFSIQAYTFFVTLTECISITCHKIPTTNGQPATWITVERCIDSSKRRKLVLFAVWQMDKNVNCNNWIFCDVRSETVNDDIFQSLRRSVLWEGSSADKYPWHDRWSIGWSLLLIPFIVVYSSTA